MRKFGTLLIKPGLQRAFKSLLIQCCDSEIQISKSKQTTNGSLAIVVSVCSVGHWFFIFGSCVSNFSIVYYAAREFSAVTHHHPLFNTVYNM